MRRLALDFSVRPLATSARLLRTLPTGFAPYNLDEENGEDIKKTKGRGVEVVGDEDNEVLTTPALPELPTKTRGVLGTLSSGLTPPRDPPTPLCPCVHTGTSTTMDFDTETDLQQNSRTEVCSRPGSQGT